MPFGHNTMGSCAASTMKAVDQGLRLRIDRGIELLKGMAVARQEALEPQHVGIVGAADDDRAAGPGFDQADPAQDQRPHDALAELGLADKQRPQPLGRQDEGADRVMASASTNDGRPANWASSPRKEPGP